MTIVLAPVWGWPVAIVVCAAMTALAAAIIVRHARGGRRGRTTDETPGAVVRRVLICLVVALIALTPSTTSTVSTTAVKGMDVVVAVDVTGSMGVADAHYGSSTAVRVLHEDAVCSDTAFLAVVDGPITTLVPPISSAMAFRVATSIFEIPGFPVVGSVTQAFVEVPDEAEAPDETTGILPPVAEPVPSTKASSR